MGANFWISCDLIWEMVVWDAIALQAQGRTSISENIFLSQHRGFELARCRCNKSAHAPNTSLFEA